jgi:hypothetical protein
MMGFATPSSAQFLMKRTCRSSTRRTQCGTHIAGSARVTTSGCIERLISPAFSLQWRARARNCRRFGFSSGVACGGSSSEEAEDGEYHARAATINQEHVQPSGTSDFVLSRRRSSALHTHAAQR